MKLKSRYWAELAWTDFATLRSSPEIDQVVAVLPVAAIEQHGPHLPLSVDQALVDAIVTASLPLLGAEVPILVLPTQAVGKSTEHESFPGTLSLRSQTILQLWMDIGASVARAGVKKLVLFNSHGGQVSVMDLVARDLRAEHGLVVYSCSWFNLPQPDSVQAMFGADEPRFGIHAGDVETSMMLALAPGLVEMNLAQDFPSSSALRAQRYPVLGNGKSAKLGWLMQDYNRDGAAGNASAASAEKGHALIGAAAQALAQMLTELSGAPMSMLKSDPP